MRGILSNAQEYCGINAAPAEMIRKCRRKIIPALRLLGIHGPFYIGPRAAGFRLRLLLFTPMADGYSDLPPGKVAAVVTYLEMREPWPLAPTPTTSEYAVRRV